MIKNDLKSKYEEEAAAEYVVPEVWATTIKIGDLQTIQNGNAKYTSYCLNVDTTYPQFNGNTFVVRRRFNDFVKLRTHLEEYLSSRTWKRPVERLPELPGDTFASLLGFGRFEESFVENRRQRLEKFINKISNHPQCATEAALINFLKQENLFVF